ncbi:hypothetical protein NPIL_29781, partial [Nephila pilipes]
MLVRLDIRIHIGYQEYYPIINLNCIEVTPCIESKADESTPCEFA